jgi:hypothetical protein
MTQTAIPLSDPDISAAELEAVGSVLQSPRLSSGPVGADFEAALSGGRAVLRMARTEIDARKAELGTNAAEPA